MTKARSICSVIMAAQAVFLSSCATTEPSAPHTTPLPAQRAEQVSQPAPKPKAPPPQAPKAQVAAEPLPQPAPAAPNPEAARRTLLGADLAFSRACEEKGAPEAFYEFMAPEGVCLMAGEAPIQGADAIKVRFAAFPAEAISWKPREAQVGAESDMGYTWGTYQSNSSSTEKSGSMGNGKYAMVWKRVSDNVWKVAVFVTSPGPGVRKE